MLGSKRFIIIFLGLIFGFSANAAEPLPEVFKQAKIEERLSETVDLNLNFKNEKNETVSLRSVVDGKKPTVLLLAYYNCPNLCGLFLNGALSVLKRTDWKPGEQFNVLTLSIDAREKSDLAAQKKENYLKSFWEGAPTTIQQKFVQTVENGWHFWVNDLTEKKILNPEEDQTSVRRLARQVGFGYVYSKQDEQFAHSAAMIILTPNGKISRYLYGIEFEPKDLKLALTEAGDGKVGSVVDHFMLFCYNYDPKTKKYSLYATNLMRIGGGITVFIVGGILLGVYRRNRKQKKIL